MTLYEEWVHAKDVEIIACNRRKQIEAELSKGVEKILLPLSVSDAKFLQALVQNPFCDLEDEPKDEKHHRENIFYSIKNLNL